MNTDMNTSIKKYLIDHAPGPPFFGSITIDGLFENVGEGGDTKDPLEFLKKLQELCEQEGWEYTGYLSHY